MKKKLLWALFTIGLVALLYYLLIRPFEFSVNLKANTLPGDVIETIRIWNRSLENASILEVDSLSGLKQSIVWNKRKYIYDWRFVTLNDSVTQVSARISEPGRSFLNKILIPFTDEAIEKDAAKIVHEFNQVLKTHVKITHVKVIGEIKLDSSFCACLPLETKQIDKAKGMMRGFPALTSFTNALQLKLNGPPSVRIHQWDHNAGLLKFDFCFPIMKADSLPVADSIRYKTFKAVRVLKAEYHGNYITSDRAWYALMHYADKNGYKINGLPVEYFHSNPNLGMNEREWKADIYLPIQE